MKQDDLVYYIVPKLSDVGGQCIIVQGYALPSEDVPRHYQSNYSAFKQVGLMNSRGELVYFEGPSIVRDELIESQPLMASTVFRYALSKS